MRALFFCCLVGWCSFLAPVAETPAPLRRIAFGSCARQDKPQPIWDAVLATKPELFLFLGDTVYGDTEDMAKLRDDYAKLNAKPGFMALRQACRILGTWDDHDYGQNDAGAEYPKKKESQTEFLDFLRIPSDSPLRQRAGVYYAEVIGPPGQRVQIILLDTRYHRTALKTKPERQRGVGPYQANDDPNATVLGETQWQWLREQLLEPAELRLIGSSIQFVAEDHGFEGWMNFPRERQKLLELLKTTQAQGVIFLSGDRHLAELSVMDAGLGYPLFDLTSSGLTEGSRNWRLPEVNRHRVATMTSGNNFGLVTIDWYADDPLVRLQIRDEAGEVTLQQKIRLSTLTPRGLKPLGPTTLAALPLAAGAIAPNDAANKVGDAVTVQFLVRSTGGTGNRVFLNSAANYRDADNFTVVLEQTALEELKLDQPAEHFRNKTILVTGQVERFRDRPQIKVSSAHQIKLASP